jgi:hypothetical protein
LVEFAIMHLINLTNRKLSNKAIAQIKKQQHLNE